MCEWVVFRGRGGYRDRSRGNGQIYLSAVSSKKTLNQCRTPLCDCYIQMQQSFVLNVVRNRLSLWAFLIHFNLWGWLDLGLLVIVMSKVLKTENIRTQKNSCLMPLRVNSATSKQKVTDWPKPTGHWWRSVSHQRCTKISGWALLLLLAQCCSAFRSKTFCIETKALVASPVVTAVKQKLSLWTHVQFCNSAWEVFLKSHITPEKEASSCAGLTTVHHKLSALAFPWVPIQVQFYFLSSLLLFLFITSPTFFFPLLGVWVSV